MQTIQWGKALWTPLHAITFNYPITPKQDDKERYKKYFNLTGEILPCKYCRQSFITYSKYIPIDDFLDSREGVVYWLYVIHNLVNNKLYKPNFPLCEVVVIYEKMRAKCGKVKKDDVKYNSCAKKFYKNVNKTIIDNHIKNTKNYIPIMKKYLNKLFNSNDNPNKESIDKYLKDNM
jgi:hypothetical protein